MSTLLQLVSFSCVVVVGINAAQAASEPQRSMGVRAGPDHVFSRPVPEIVPRLQGAIATNVNGRVGSELVFWGYTLENGAPANLFACAVLEGVDCEARAALICPDANTRIDFSVNEPGDIVKRDCQAVRNARGGDIHPGCASQEIRNDLLVGLASCPDG